MNFVPAKFFLTKGVGMHKKDMRAREEALRDAGMPMLNLVKTSSIIPPGCKRIPREEGVALLKPGQITFAVIAQSQTNEPGQIVTAGIAMAQPEIENEVGYLTEQEEIIGRTAEDVARDVEEMAIENLATAWDLKLKTKDIWKQGQKAYTLEDKKIAVDNLVQTATGHEDRLYTMVFVAAVFIL